MPTDMNVGLVNDTRLRITHGNTTRTAMVAATSHSLARAEGEYRRRPQNSGTPMKTISIDVSLLVRAARPTAAPNHAAVRGRGSLATR